MAVYGISLNFQNLPIQCNVILESNLLNNSNRDFFVEVTGENYNGNITLPETSRNIWLSFYECWNFNGKINLSNSVNSCASLLDYYRCPNYNQPITIPDSVVTCQGMFYGLNSFDSVVDIGNNVTDCYGMFGYCHKFNKSVYIPSNVINCNSMFRNGENFNSPVIMSSTGDNCSCANMFYSCTNFNKPISIPGTVTDCSLMFAGCRNFDSPVTLHEGVKNAYVMFGGCNNFRQSISIPDSIQNACSMFEGCSNLSSYFGIPASATDCNNMYRDTHRTYEDLGNGSLRIKSTAWYDDVYVPDGVGNKYCGVVSTGNFRGTISVPIPSYTGGSAANTGNYYIGIYSTSGPYNTIDELPYLGATVIVRSTGEVARIESKMINYGRNYGKYYTVWSGSGSSPYAGRVDYDEPTTIPEGTTSMSDYFTFCTKYDQSTIIPNSVTDCSYTFSQCYSFNSPIIFED